MNIPTVTNVTNVPRLTRLRDLLLADADNPVGIKFDLGFWMGIDDGTGRMQKANLLSSDVEKISMSCGTSACALGLACLDPGFQKEGLKYELYQSYGMIVPTYEGLKEWEAGRTFFGLSWNQAYWLFDPDHYKADEKRGAVAEREVACRIDHILADPGLDPFGRDRGQFALPYPSGGL